MMIVGIIGRFSTMLGGPIQISLRSVIGAPSSAKDF
jgi:hypothetical protein